MKPKVYTASFRIIKKLDNYCQLAVSSGIPKWYKGGRYKKLAPSYQLVRRIKDAQLQSPTFSEDDIRNFSNAYYDEVLSKLEPLKVYEELCNISGNTPIVLLSHESSDEYSVRKVIKVWFESVGIICEELQ